MLLTVLSLLLLALLGRALARQVGPSLWTLAEGQATLWANQALYRALTESACSSERLLTVEADASGRVRSLRPDTASLQAVAARVLASLQEQMARPGSWDLRLPLGQLLGDGLWAAWGPPVPVRVIPVGVARVDFRDTWEGAGINQTKYSLYLDVALAVMVAVPFWRERVEVRCSVPVAQAVLVGEVPPGMLYLGPGGR